MTETMVKLDTAEAVRQHLDVAVSEPERRERAVRLVLCGLENEVLVHCVVGGDEKDAPRDVPARARMITVFARELSSARGSGAIVVVVTRPGPVTIGENERMWFRAAHQVCAELGVRLLGVHLMTPRGQREVSHDDAG